MKKLIFQITPIIALLLISCGSSSTETNENKIVEQVKIKKPTFPPLSLRYTSYEAKGDELIKLKDSTFNFEEKYLDIDLTKMVSNTYTGTKQIKEFTLSNKVSESIQIIDDSVKLVQFNSATEFLNYMDKRGFDMETKEEKKYKTTYTFKRRS